MNVSKIANATRVLGAPANWDESRDGECVGLPVRDYAGGWMVSEWKPTQDEIAALAANGSVRLWVQGNSHPVVSLGVSDAAGNDTLSVMARLLNDERDKVKLLRHALMRLGSSMDSQRNIITIALGATE